MITTTRLGFISFLSFFLCCWVSGVHALAPQQPQPFVSISRRSCLATTAGLCFGFVAVNSNKASAAEAPVYGPCLESCVKECTALAPGEANKAYCVLSCEDYCRATAEEGAPSGKGDVGRQDRS